jgi:hypothetical protein
VIRTFAWSHLSGPVGGVGAKPWTAVALVAGVLIAWPALLLVGLPFVGIYFLVRRLRDKSAIDHESPAQSDESKPAGKAEEAQVTETG